MKEIYKVSIFCIFILFIIIEVFIIFTPLGSHEKFKNTLQSAGMFIALSAAIVALSSSDKKIQSIKSDISFSHFSSPSIYLKNDLHEEIRAYYKDPVIFSHKVHFKLKNTSGYSLKRPVFSFKIPNKKRHPEKIPRENKIYNVLTFNSNLYNVQIGEERLIDLGDHIIFSNSILAYWNHNEEIIIWIRMAVYEGDYTNKINVPFIVEVSINCDNADGINKSIEINPKKLDDDPSMFPAKRDTDSISSSPPNIDTV